MRKTQFTREDVVLAAFELVRRKGIDQLSARNVARQLGSSTAPVYSNFASMDELQAVLYEKAAHRMLDFATRPHTENPFLNMGVGLLLFARECPRWYQALSMRRDLAQIHMAEVVEHLLAVMATVPGLADLHPLERKFLLRKMEIFTHGLATEICTGQIDDQTMEDFRRILDEVGGALTAEACNRPPRNEDQLTRLAVFCHETPAFSPLDPNPES